MKQLNLQRPRPGGVNFDNAFKLASYMLLLSGFAALVTSQAIGPILGVIYLAALLGSWRFEFPVSHRLQVALFGLLLLVFVFDVVLWSGFVPSSVHLLILISLVKVYGKKSNKDYLLIYSISFTFLLIASTYTISVVFLIALIVFIFFSILTFILFETKMAYEENRAAYFSLRAYLQAALIITALIILVSVPIFVVIPRGALGLFRPIDPQGGNLSGFSDRVTLGEMGRIINNRSVFMRVEIDQRPEAISSDLKWRGIVLDRYDGKAWSNTGRNDSRLIPQDLRDRVFPVENRRTSSSPLTQRIALEHASNVIFGADRIVQIYGLKDGLLRQDANGSLSVYDPRSDPPEYWAHSEVISRAEKLNSIQEGTIPQLIRRRYLGLPANLDPRIGEWAAGLTQDREGAVTKALLLEDFLRNNYDYSLENKPAASPDPLADFLFRTRAGHCEYFATALAVGLRTLGIPSRIVNGFQRGEFNEWSDYFIVRQSDAHSWVEAYFPGAGWVELDATPPGLDDRYRLSLWAGQFLDAVDRFWSEVINFDRLKQIGFFVSMGSNIRLGMDRMAESLAQLDDYGQSWVAALKEWKNVGLWEMLLLVGGGLLAAALYLYRRRLRALWRRKLSGTRPNSTPDYYLELLELLKQKGYQRRPFETPSEFLARLTPSLELGAAVRITELYYRDRYGSFHPGRQELAEVQAGLRLLGKSITMSDRQLGGQPRAS